MYELKLIRRLLQEEALTKVTAANDVVKYVEQRCQSREEQWREMAWLLTLNQSNEITGHFLLSCGGTTSTVIDKKIAVKVALDQLAEGVILVHNHPSGKCLPSSADIHETDGLRKALGLFDINLIDHVIIGNDGRWYSFAEYGK